MKLISASSGDFLVVEHIEEGKKVTCEMVHILYPPQIKDLKADNEWPATFLPPVDSPTHTEYRTPKTFNSDSDNDSDDSLEANVNQANRPFVYLSDSEDSDETESEDEPAQEGTGA